MFIELLKKYIKFNKNDVFYNYKKVVKSDGFLDAIVYDQYDEKIYVELTEIDNVFFEKKENYHHIIKLSKQNKYKTLNKFSLKSDSLIDEKDYEVKIETFVYDWTKALMPEEINYDQVHKINSGGKINALIKCLKKKITKPEYKNQKKEFKKILVILDESRDFFDVIGLLDLKNIGDVVVFSSWLKIVLWEIRNINHVFNNIQIYFNYKTKPNINDYIVINDNFFELNYLLDKIGKTKLKLKLQKSSYQPPITKNASITFKKEMCFNEKKVILLPNFYKYRDKLKISFPKKN